MLIAAVPCVALLLMTGRPDDAGRADARSSAPLVDAQASPSPAVEPDPPRAGAIKQPDAAPVTAPTSTSGDVVVTARSRPAAGDPLQAINMQSFRTTQAIDEAVTGPAARAYARVLPSPIRIGLRNFVLNLYEPVVFLNYMLQLKPGKAAETVGRFAVNSTLGVAGLVDVAKRRPFRLPRRPNGLGDTLGYYGVGPGPFFYLPLIGPTTVRDLIGGVVDRLVLPLSVGGVFRKPVYVITSGVSRALDRRAEADDRIERFRATSNPYAASRAAYFERRRAQIAHLHAHGKPGISARPGSAMPPLISLPEPAPLPR